MRGGILLLVLLSGCPAKKESASCGEQCRRAACVARSRDLAIFSVEPLLKGDVTQLKTAVPRLTGEEVVEAWVGANLGKKGDEPWKADDEVMAAHTTPQQSYSLDVTMRTLAGSAPQIREGVQDAKRVVTVSNQVMHDGKRLGTAVVTCRLPEESAAP